MLAMSIDKLDFETIRHEHKPFVVVYTEVIQKITDAFAGFIWVYLQSLPADWRVNKAHLMHHFNIGEDKYDKHIKYLKDANLVEFIRERDEKGVFKRGVLHVLNGSAFQCPSTGGKTPVVESSTGGIIHGVENPGGGFYPPLTNTIDNTNTKKYIHNAPPSASPNSLDPKYEYPETYFQPKEPEVVADENPHNIPQELIQEWMAVRKKRRASTSQRVWVSLNKQLALCPNPIEAFSEMLDRGWLTLKVEWLNKQRGTKKSSGVSYQTTSWLQAATPEF